MAKQAKKRKRKPYTEKRKQEAITIALATSAAEASRQTGIPAGTIRAWKNRRQVPAEAPVAAVEAIEAGLQRATDIIADQMSSLAVDAFNLAKNALAEAALMIGNGSVNTSDGGPVCGRGDLQAKWLHAVIGAFGQATQKAMLLSGKPTSRLEEHHIERTEEAKVAIITQLTNDRELASRAVPVLRALSGGNGNGSGGGLPNN